jgi:hypothetical protein
MAIYLIDKKKWFLLTKEEAKRILAANLPYFTRSNIQPYLLY